eukprot:688378-Prorocentrum_minimum.AAC.1
MVRPRTLLVRAGQSSPVGTSGFNGINRVRLRHSNQKYTLACRDHDLMRFWYGAVDGTHFRAPVFVVLGLRVSKVDGLPPLRSSLLRRSPPFSGAEGAFTGTEGGFAGAEGGFAGAE